MDNNDAFADGWVKQESLLSWCGRKCRRRREVITIPNKLDYVIEKSGKMNSDERLSMRDFAGIYLSSSEAKDVWGRILDHKWFISERLGRDVGLRVAAIDYIENIQPIRTKKRGLKGWFLRAQEWLRARAANSETILAAFEDAMRGTRSLAR